MKKVIVCLMSLFVFGAPSFAVVTQFTETLPAATPGGSVPISNGYTWSLTSNAINTTPALTLPQFSLAFATTTLTANTTGQMIFIGSGAAQAPTICISSGSTTTNQWVLLISTGIACR